MKHIKKKLLIGFIEELLSSKDKQCVAEHLKACEECKKESESLAKTYQLTNKYFKEEEITYSENMEARIIKNIYTAKPAFRAFQFPVTFLKPVFVSFILICFALLSFIVVNQVKENAIKNTVASYLKQNKQAAEFVYSYNMDHVVQFYLQSSTEESNVNYSNVYKDIKDSLVVYLSTKMDNKYIQQHYKTISKELDKYAEDYFNQINDNYESILI